MLNSLVLILSVAWAAEPPFSIRELKNEKDAHAVMQNDRALADSIKRANERLDDLEAADSDSASSSGGSGWTTQHIFSATAQFTYPSTITVITAECWGGGGNGGGLG